MNARMKATTGLATIFIVIVMGVSLMFTTTHERDARFEESSAWSTPFQDVQSLQLIDLNGDGANDVFVQNRSSYAVFDRGGEQIWREDLAEPLTTTMGDVNGDGGEDVVTFQPSGAVGATSGGRALWTTALSGVAGPARAAVIRFGSGTQVVVGDDQGRIVALSGSDGRELWRAELSGTSETRGLDDAIRDGDRLLIAADRAGFVGAYSDRGQLLWRRSINGLRRMRSFDTNGDGQGEIYFGGEGGTLSVVDIDGEPLWSVGIGQQVVEVRDGELDGDPASREVVVGGRQGGVFAVTADGRTFWSANVGDRVSDLVTVDLDDDGAEEVVVGDESGGLTVFGGGSGTRYRLGSTRGGVAALEDGNLTASDQVLVAAGTTVEALQLTRHDAPIFYTPLLAGLVLSLVIAGAAVFVGGLPEQPPTRIVVTDSSPAGLLARRRMLFENIADVEELKAQGEIEGPAALTKLEELRRQLAETDQELRRAGVTTSAETMKCPNCGGRVRLGRDRCDYCGEVVIA